MPFEARPFLPAGTLARIEGLLSFRAKAAAHILAQWTTRRPSVRRRPTMKAPRISTAAAGILMAASVVAFAQTSPVVIEAGIPTAVVSYADLNITSAAGRHTLEGRVARAASDLCLEGRPRPLEEFMARRQCFSAAVSRAQADIDLAVAQARTQLASSGTIKVAAR
jgi:UrcA family protein